MKDALSLQGAMIGEMIVNDGLRSFFIDLCYEELDLIDKMAQYGKFKGWVINEPVYRDGQES